jgi:hypothetical protein
MKKKWYGWLMMGVLLVLGACSQDDGSTYSEEEGEGDSSKTSEKESDEDLNIFVKPNEARIKLVIRDFSVDHPDFENFSEDFVRHGAEIQAYGKMGYDADWADRSALHVSCGNGESGNGAAIGTNGLPTVPNEALPAYLQQTGTATLK